TMVLKPSEMTPYSAELFARVLEEAGVPQGVFNLVHGDGRTVGSALAAHPDIDMVSFTGSTAAGIEVAIRAAPTVKRVCQELGGNPASILPPDADFDHAVRQAVAMGMDNTGQSCNAPTRLLVPQARHDEVLSMAEAAARKLIVGDPQDPATEIGPLASSIQFDRVRGHIGAGSREGAVLVTGGDMAGQQRGYFVAPAKTGSA